LAKYEIRNTFVPMIVETQKIKRAGKSYKVAPAIYEKAVKKASKNNTNVANVIEKFLHRYVKNFKDE